MSYKVNREQFETLKQEIMNNNMIVDTNRIVAQHIIKHDNLKIQGRERPIAIRSANGGKSLNAGQMKVLSKYQNRYCENLDLNYIMIETVGI